MTAPDTPAALGARVATTTSTPAEIELIADHRGPQLGSRVVTGFTQAAHGRVTLLGSKAIYTPTPGYAGADSFRYTVSSADGKVQSATVAIAVAQAVPACSITISGPSSAIMGPAIHLTAAVTCNFGTPEIQWRHRTGTSGTFSTFKNFSTQTTADFSTTGAALGTHQFMARVRVQGTTPLFSSNTLGVSLVASTAPCTAVTLDAPAGGAVFATGQAIAMHGTATCPAGVTPEYQYWVKQATDPAYTVLPGYFAAGSSYTPPQAGDWTFVTAARAVGASAPFQVQSAEVSVRISHAPTAVDDTLTVSEDHSGTVAVLANDSDPDGDPLIATITTAPAAGTATIAAGVVTYRPAADYNGNDTIGYTVSDGHGNAATAVVHVTITPVNDAPSAQHDFVTVAEDSSALIDVTQNDVDVDGDALSIAAISAPEHGTAVVAGNVVLYTPAPDYHGADAFEYTIADPSGEHSTASVFVTVTAANDAPGAVDDQLATAEDTAGSVDLLANDGDRDGDPLSVAAFDQPLHGSVSVAAGVATYVPAHDYNGLDAFGYTVQDPSGATSTAIVHVTVAPVNDPPAAADDAASLDEDTRATIDVVVNDSDIDGDPLTVASVTQPAHGTVAITSGHEVTYTPAADYHGGDSFRYTIIDAGGATATATVTLAIANVNDPPVAAADEASVDEDGTVTIDVVANDGDIDGDAVAVIAISQPAHGVAEIVDGRRVAYTPAANYHGPDAFGYTIGDGNGGEAGAVVAIAVNAVNDPPVAAGDAATLDEDGSVTIDVVANDTDLDGDTLAVTAITQPAHGVTEIVDGGHVAYTPAPNYHGPDAFSYTISDGNGGEAGAAVAITVNPVNDPPVAAGDAASLLEDGSATIDVAANDSDIDGDALEITAVTQGAHGTVVIGDAHHVVYAPAPNYHGPDAFSYTIADPSGGRATAAVAIEVIGVNDAPVAADDAASLDEDTSVTVDVVGNDGDIDGDALAIASVTQPAHGLASVTDATHVLYVPAPDYHGRDAFSYTIGDGHGGQATAAVTIDVVSVNDAPVAASDAASLDEDTSVTVDVVANDRDVDGDALAIGAITQPAHGTAAIAGLHQVSYTPAANYHGPDSVSYTIDDGHGGQATATLAIDVVSVNDAPVATGDAASLAEDSSISVDVAANDSDIDGDALAVASVTQPAHGAAAIADAHHVSYTPAANYHGPDAFSYTIGDGNGGQATAQVAITVTSVNDAPVAYGVTLSTFDDTPAAAALAASDVDGDALTFAIATLPAHGTLGAVIGSRVTYTPAPGFVGSDAFTFTASDGLASSAPATVRVTVVASVCGNGIREGSHEECDDGNATPGDGCESSCKLTCGSGTGADRATVDAASGHCFAAYDGVQHSYQAAAALCTAIGGHLPTITSASEDTAARGAVHAGDTPWLGAADVATEGTFGWITGEPFGYSHFHAGKPDNAGNADCVQYLADGSWSDAPCSGIPTGVTGTLCELDLAVTTPAFATGGGGTRGVAIADVNGDGRADIAAVNPANNTVGILIGDGGGGFALQATYATGAGPTAIAAGDFDRDGHPDLAVVNATANTVGILRGTASGAFVAGATVAIPAGSTAITVADLDQDGALDLVVAASATVRLLHGDGAGGFTALGSIAITGVPASIAAGDFDHDGRIDLALTTPAAVLVVMGTGGGAFGLPVSLAVSLNNRAILATDLDGDGNLDLAVANGAATVSVWFGAATGLSGAPTNLTIAGTPQLVAAGDFDGDGGTDLVALTGNYATVFHGAGRSFTQAGPLIATGGGGASFAAVASLNGDAAADLVVANAATSNAGILLGGSGGLIGARALPAGTGSTSAVSADFNEDGRADLAVVDPPTNRMLVFLQSASGALVPAAPITMPAGAGSTFAAYADFNNDGHVDLIVTNTNNSSVSVMLGTGTGAFGAPLITGCGAQPRRIAVADFNGDGRIDVAVPSATGNLIAILVGNGAGRFGRLADVPAGVGPAAVVVGDFNGDGKKDIAIAATGEASVRVALGVGNGTFGATTAFPVASAGQALAAGDLDGDGKLDLVSTNTTTASVGILLGAGNGSFGAVTSVAVGTQPAAVAVADLDGDGRLDVVVGNAGTSDLTVLHNAGAGGFVGTSFGLGVAPGWLSIADFDRDGHLDIATVSSSSFATLLYSGR
ncbi:MAG TPA: Ig-like domain-containing protein [Kofleriaceae bacterium]